MQVRIHADFRHMGEPLGELLRRVRESEAGMLALIRLEMLVLGLPAVLYFWLL